ncbi:DUF4349 domain-containing protein [Oscillospiraceae bacterium LTW-04]|nr:DUF4349 domain-containing protein [Oscillospiraceae bacterium MB24-C1]
MQYKKSILSALAIILAVLAICAACSSTSVNDKAAPSETSAASHSNMQLAIAEGSGRMVAHAPAEISTDDQNKTDIEVMTPDRKIVKHSHLSLESKEFDTAFEQILTVITEQGGYIENQSINGQSLTHRGSYYERSASIQARIPADKLDSVTTAVGGICNVTSKSENIDDITDRYFDTQAHLNSLKLQEERLLDILSKADKLEDVISLERALSDVRYQIESLTATMRRMDSQVAYSYLNLDLREVVEYQPVESAPKTLGDKISASFKRSGEKLAWFFEALLLFVIEDLPLIVICLAVLGSFIFISFRTSRRVKFKMNENKNKISSAKPNPQQDPPAEK